MEPRIQNPASLIPDAMKSIQGLVGAAHSAGVPVETVELVHRASAISMDSWLVAGEGSQMHRPGHPKVAAGCDGSRRTLIRSHIAGHSPSPAPLPVPGGKTLAQADTTRSHSDTSKTLGREQHAQE